MSGKLSKEQFFLQKRGVFLALVLVIIILAAWFLLWSGPVSKKDILGVVLISIDTCRADYLSCYGYPDKTTPNIDALAKEGILFENAIAPLPLTLPGHTTMLTGTIPPYHGVHDNDYYKVGPSNETIAEVLKLNGFSTGAIISAFVLDSRFGLDQGFDSYNDSFVEEPNSVSISQRRAGEATRFALEWLDKNKSKSFFMFLHYFDPHWPYEPPEPFDSVFADNLYAGEIAYTDYCIGQVIRKLKNLGLYDSTIIVITSDHGEMLGEHGEQTHGYFLYESAVKVPLIVKIPKGPKGKRIYEVVGLIDIVPTIYSCLQMPIPAHIPGEDLSGYFAGTGGAYEDRYLYCESLYPTKYGGNSLLAVTSNHWKYIQTTRPELYNLDEDPQETNNLLQERPKQVHLLKEHLKSILEKNFYKDREDTVLILDSEAQERLASLGYVTSIKVDENFTFDQSREDPKDLIDFHLANASADILIAMEEYDKAKNICNRMLEERPHFIEIHRYLGKIAFQEDDMSAAVDHYSKYLDYVVGQQGAGLIKADPQIEMAHVELGQALLQLEKLEQAMVHFDQVLQLNLDNPKLYYRIGNALNNVAKFKEALEHYNKALTIDPNSPQVHSNLGAVLLKMGKYNAAVASFKQALRLEPGLEEARSNLKVAEEKKEELERVISTCMESLKQNPQQPDMHGTLGLIFHQKGDIEKAVYHWSMALQLRPNWVEVLNNLAWAKAAYKNASFHKPAEAIQLAQRASELTDNEEPGVLDTLSVAYAAAGRLSEAVEIAEKALSLAQSSNQQQLAEEIQSHLELYKHGQPYYDDSAQ
ncbi:MAG: sulfatase-like hydrolase/transferase [Planctomycetota bacterium]|jgi:arylsulfatase A-like enzyme/Flp pilus assembly protein TadD